jgi:hypothetical protein
LGVRTATETSRTLSRTCGPALTSTASTVGNALSLASASTRVAIARSDRHARDRAAVGAYHVMCVRGLHTTAYYVVQYYSLCVLWLCSCAFRGDEYIHVAAEYRIDHVYRAHTPTEHAHGGIDAQYDRHASQPQCHTWERHLTMTADQAHTRRRRHQPAAGAPGGKGVRGLPGFTTPPCMHITTERARRVRGLRAARAATGATSPPQAPPEGRGSGVSPASHHTTMHAHHHGKRTPRARAARACSPPRGGRGNSSYS